uniref:Uncharacterized protein n=1 Tax=Candidatus Kentrum sp. FW TaxID=2126338 RepID=A0A450T1X6_9GAMM|nr:MAG: hypothetical protein BECKFW1821A_GA0114235_11034 [Candidatus Kentron sp. FW]
MMAGSVNNVMNPIDRPLILLPGEPVPGSKTQEVGQDRRRDTDDGTSKQTHLQGRIGKKFPVPDHRPAAQGKGRKAVGGERQDQHRHRRSENQ